jgi:hypothetical protein
MTPALAEEYIIPCFLVLKVENIEKFLKKRKKKFPHCHHFKIFSNN